MAGQPDQYRVVVTNYIKQGDNMTIVMDKTTLSLVSLTIATYLNDPSDAVVGTVRETPIERRQSIINYYQRQLPLDLQPQLPLLSFQVAELVLVLWSQRDASL